MTRPIRPNFNQRLAINQDRARIRNLERRFVNQGTTVGVTAEAIFLDTTIGTITSETVLTDGAKYLITVQGTYSLWNNDLETGTPESDAMFPTTGSRSSTEVGLDAETIFAYHAGGFAIGHTTIFKIDLGDGPEHKEPDGGFRTSPTENHLYSYSVVGRGSPATFTALDSPAGDNYGKLRIIIQALDGGDPGSGGGGGGGGGGTIGGTGSLVPPADTSLDGDVLTVVDGIPEWAASSAAVVWRPVMTLDGSGNYVVVTDGHGDAVMTHT